MVKDIKKLIEERHKIIKANQNVKQYVLRRLTKQIDKDIKKYTLFEIRRLKSVLLELERDCETNKAEVEKEQTRLIK